MHKTGIKFYQFDNVISVKKTNYNLASDYVRSIQYLFLMIRRKKFCEKYQFANA